MNRIWKAIAIAIGGAVGLVAGFWSMAIGALIYDCWRECRPGQKQGSVGHPWYRIS